MDSDVTQYRHDAFLSYSRNDLAFARALEANLESFRIPRGLTIPEHNLEIFRDESDFTGTEYYESIKHHLQQSATLVVICSPDAATSGYVDDEIRRFVRSGPGRERKIIPILYRGIPNNEVESGQEQEVAFPAALCESLGMPLGINYRGFDLTKHKMSRGAYFNSWYALLANICGVSRADIEERDRLRQVRHRRIQIAVVSAVFLALLVALTITLFSRQQAVRERKIAEAGELSATALNAMSGDPQLGLLLGLEAAVLSYSADRTISIEAQEALHHALLTQRERLRLFVNQSFVNTVAFSPDRRLLATADSSEVRLWDTVSGVQLPIQFNGAGKVLTLAFSPDGTRLATGGRDNTARLWEVKSGRDLAVFEGHKGYIWSVAFSPDGTRLATASADSTVKLWSLASRRELKTLTGHTAFVDTVAFSHDGKLLASGGADNVTRIWDAESGRQLSVMPGGGDNGGIVRGAAFSPDDHRLATVNSASTEVKIWNVFSGREVSTFHGHTGSVFAVAYSPDGSQVATSSLDKTARLWDTASGKELLVFTGHSEAVVCVAFSADGAHLATGSEDGTARIWEVEQPEEFHPLVGHTAALNGVAFSPDGSRIASASDDSTARIWKLSTGEELITLTHAAAVSGVAFSPDGARIATASADREAKVFDVASGAKLLSLAGHSAAVTSVAYSHDGRRLITGSSDKTAKIWDASTGNEQVTMRTNLDQIESVDLNRDGTRAALGIANEGDNTIASAQIWDVGSNRDVGNLDGDYVLVSHVQFDPDGTRLVTTGYTPPFVTDIWDVQSGQKLLTMAGHTAAVLTAAFSPDGQSLATGGVDLTIRLWDLRDGRELLTLPSPKASVRSLAFSPDGKQLASAGSDGIVRLYAIDPMDLMVLGASQLARGLTADECRRYLRRGDCSTTVSSRLFTAKQFAQEGNTATAMKIFSQVFPGNEPDSGESYAKLLLSELRMSEARERAEAGDFSGAGAAFRAALSLQSHSSVQSEQEGASLVAMAQVRHAKRLQALSRWGDAAAVLQQAVTFDPKEEEAYVDLADAFNHTAQYDKAVDAMRHAVQIRPSASNMLDLANNLRLNKQYPEAATQLNQAIGLDPDNERAHRILGLIYLATRDSDKALNEFQAAIAIKPTVSAYEQLAGIYESRKKFGQALENLNKAKAINKTYIPLYENAERIYHEEQGDFGAAYRELSEARTVAPDDVPLAANFAEACLTDSRFQEAIDTVDNLLGSRLPSPDLSVSDQVALKFIGVVALSLNGHTQEADAARREFMTYFTALAPFKQTWDYAGTRRFLAEYEMNQDQRAQLLKLLALIELRKTGGR